MSPMVAAVILTCCSCGMVILIACMALLKMIGEKIAFELMYLVVGATIFVICGLS